MSSQSNHSRSAEPARANFPGTATLAEVRAWVAENRRHGAICPGCDLRAQIYRRSMTGAQAAALIRMLRAYGREFGHAPTVVPHYEAAMVANLRFWGLIEEQGQKRDDGGRAGMWRVTDLGERFARGVADVPKYVLTYGGELLEAEEDEWIDIHEALGKKFDYDELMSS